MNAPMRRAGDEVQASILKRLEDGDQTMKLLVQQNRAAMLAINRIETDLSTNTRISVQALEMAQKTAADTASLVALDKGAKRGFQMFAGGAEKIEKARKIITPWAIFVAGCLWLWHGLTGHGFAWPSWSDIREWTK